MIAGWLSNQPARNGVAAGTKPGFELILFGEGNQRGPAQTTGIRQALRESYLDPGYAQGRVQDGAHATEEDVYQAEAFSRFQNVRRGDFGEILGEYLIGTVGNLQCELPRSNYANKENVDLAARGFDYLGFKFSEVHGSDVVLIGEAKYRATQVSNIYLAGQVTLRNYTREREIKEIGKVAHQLHGKGDIAGRERLARFSNGFSTETFSRQHVLIVLHDSNTNIQSAISKIPARTGLRNFTIVDVSIPDLNGLVDLTFSR